MQASQLLSARSARLFATQSQQGSLPQREPLSDLHTRTRTVTRRSNATACLRSALPGQVKPTPPQSCLCSPRKAT